jgi:hypothetical protein
MTQGKVTRLILERHDTISAMLQSENKNLQEQDNEATVQIMAELTRWVRERPGWVMQPSNSAATVLETINLPKTRQS